MTDVPFARVTSVLPPTTARRQTDPGRQAEFHANILTEVGRIPASVQLDEAKYFGDNAGYLRSTLKDVLTAIRDYAAIMDYDLERFRPKALNMIASAFTRDPEWWRRYQSLCECIGGWDECYTREQLMTVAYVEAALWLDELLPQ